MRNRVEFNDGVWLVETPAVLRMIDAALKESPELVGCVMRVRSVMRHRGTRFSYHEEGRAVDIDTGLSTTGEASQERGAVKADNALRQIAAIDEWARRIRWRLGGEHDIVFGDAQHFDHIHHEHDRKKEERWYGDE